MRQRTGTEAESIVAAAKKKRRATAKPPPIEGEILSENPAGESSLSSESPKARNSADILRRLAWYLGAAGVVFIAGLVAAPAIQEGIDSLLGREDSAPTETRVETRENLTAALSPALAPAPAPEAVIKPVEALPVPDEQSVGEPANDDEAPVAAQADAAPVTDYRKITERLQVLEARLASLEARPVPDPDSRPREDSGAGERITDLEARLARVESLGGAQFTGSGADKMLLALAHLSQRLDGGEAYAGEMLEFRAFFAALPDAARTASEAHVAVLEAEAESGVKNAAMLHRAFADALPAALAVAALPEDAGWWDRLWAGLKGVVVVRRVGQVEGAGAEAALARAEFSLTEGDIAAALGEIQNLEARIRESLAPWQAEAAKSLSARSALDALIGSYSASPGQQSPTPSAPLAEDG